MALTGLALASCSAGDAGEPRNATVEAPTPTPAPAPKPTEARLLPDGYVGRWTGVEGMFADITPATEPGTYQVTMQWDLDHRGTFEARQMPMELGLGFYRNGNLERLEPSNGDRTGLKYLAGKKECLLVKPGEGYCRD